MKKLTIISAAILICVLNQFNAYSQDDPTQWKYFTILSRASDDSLFIKIQEDMQIYPLLETYTINIDIRDSDIKNQYVILGVVNDPTAFRFAWSIFRDEVRQGLINWNKPNKIKLE